MMKACQLNSMVALKSCREGSLPPPPGDASACEAATAYAGALREVPSLSSVEKVRALAKEGGGFAFHGNDLLKKMTRMPDDRRRSLLEAMHASALEWFSRIASADGTPCSVGTSHEANDNSGPGPWR
jgi:hypothetical protein